MIKIIGIDLDDTLLDSDKNISDDNIEAIKRVTKMGAHVVITTGRPYFRIVSFLKTIGLYNDSSFAISYNGSLISNATKTFILDDVKFTNDDVRFIVERLKELALHFNIYQDEFIYSEEVLPLIKKQKVFEGIVFAIRPYDELLKINEASKIIICEYRETIDKMRFAVEKALGDKYNILRSTDLYLEILPKDANKGIALNKLMSYLKIDHTQAMAIGDEENDLPMFTYVDYKVAMANGSEKIKKQANFITKTQNESGVAYAIEKVLKMNK